MKKLLLILAGLFFSIHMGAQTTYLLGLENDPAYPDQGLEVETDGSIPIQPNQYCEIIPFPAPSITAFGHTVTGTTSGLLGLVKSTVAAGSGDIIVVGTANVHYDYIPCDFGGHINSYGIRVNIGLAVNTHTVTTVPYAPTYQAWPVSQSCEDVPIAQWGDIDFKPIFSLPAAYSFAWDMTGVCWRECDYAGETVPFSCVPAPWAQKPKSNVTGHCSYHPQCL